MHIQGRQGEGWCRVISIISDRSLAKLDEVTRGIYWLIWPKYERNPSWFRGNSGKDAVGRGWVGFVTRGRWGKACQAGGQQEALNSRWKSGLQARRPILATSKVKETHWKAQMGCRIIKSAKEPGSLVWGIQGAWDELTGAFPSMNEHQPSPQPHHVSLLKMLRCLCTPIRMAEMEKTDHSKCGQACGGTGLLHCWRECEIHNHLTKHFLKL